MDEHIEDQKPVDTESMATQHQGLRYEAAFKNLPELPIGSKVLDVGAGREGSLIAQHLGQSIKDVEVAHLDYVATHPKKLRNPVGADAARLPFASGSFDSVIVAELTLDNPYFDQDKKQSAVTEEAHRVLKKGGHLLVYHEREKLPIPAGFISIHHQVDKMVHNHPKFDFQKALMFGDYEKFAPIIEETLFHDNLDDVGVNNPYIQKLSELYPPEVLFSEEDLVAFDRGEPSNVLTSIVVDLLGNYEIEHNFGMTLMHGVKDGFWGVTTSERENPQSAIERLKSISKPRSNSSDKMLWHMVHSPYFIIGATETELITIPSQRAFDAVLSKKRKTKFS